MSRDTPQSGAGNTESAGALPRRPTPDPNRFLIPADGLPPGFADRLSQTGSEPVAPRPAATVVLVRAASDSAGAGGFEALLLRRHGRSGFAADAWVFPGGTVDPQDRDPALAVLCDGPPPETWANRLGIEDSIEAFGYVMAALREAFEETGILLAGGRDGPGEATRSAARFRDPLLAGQITLREIADVTGVRFAIAEWIYVAHWITPEPEPRRFDTRFFVAPVHPDQECVPHRSELVEARWLAPAEAVDRFAAGELKMLPPTVHTLRRLAAYGSIPEMVGALRDAPVPAYLPVMRRGPEGVIIEIT